MTGQKRITYFDIAKGLMILGLLVSHFSIVKTHLGMKNDFRYLDMFITTYSGFFMQCFFFITGFCSCVLEFYGKNSLIVYCVHIIPLYYISRLVFHDLHIACDFYGSYYVLFLFVFALTSLAMTFFILLFTKTPLKKCIGK